MKHVVPLLSAKDPQRRVVVTFDEKPFKTKQARFVGRSVLQPELELDDYRFNALIDWVEVEVSLMQATQFQHVQTVAANVLNRKCFVKAVHAGTGNTATTFLIRVQEPKSIRDVMTLNETIGTRYGLAGPTKINAIEISVDAYPTTPNDQARAQLLGVMQRTLFPREDVFTNQNMRPRLSWNRNKPTYIAPHPLHAYEEGRYFQPVLDATMSVAAKGGDVMVRLMDKVIDTQNVTAGTLTNLGPKEKRVRIEVTLMGAGLKRVGVSLLEDLKTMSFIKLQGEFFTFRLFTVPANNSGSGTSISRLVKRYEETINRRIFLKAGIVGLLSKEHVRMRGLERMKALALFNLRTRGRRLKKMPAGRRVEDNLRAYQELNERVTRALRDLQHRERRALEN